MTKRREKSLRDHIRVNLRKVMAEAKSMERKEAEKQAKMDEREKEARYSLTLNTFLDLLSLQIESLLHIFTILVPL